MKYALMASIIMTFPAFCALIYGLVYGPKYLVYAALVSFGLNTLPFIAAGLMMRRQKGGPDLGH
jgi:hypothetical protein